MTPRIESLRAYLLEKRQSDGWREIDWSHLTFSAEDSREKRAADCFCAVLAEEQKSVRFLPEERIAFTRSVKNLPTRYSPEEWGAMRAKAYFHELGVVFNLTVDYPVLLAEGLEARRGAIIARRETAFAQNDDAGIAFLDAAAREIDALLLLADAYRDQAAKLGQDQIAETLSQVPRRPARTFLEALQAVRILHFALWCEGTYHNGVGRIDQYLWPYLKADLAAGRIDRAEAFELLEEFFLSFNRDSDLYVGVQQGDNGQSLMLGGCDSEGRNAANPLTEMALDACRELKLIDPKINLRVSSQTPISLLEKATELTRLGLGFPQYANDDVVIPGLVRLGYDLSDARNYTVAACWEFIIPGVGIDIPNIAAVSFPGIVNAALHSAAGQSAPTFDAFFAQIQSELFAEADRIERSLAVVDMLPCPLTSAFCDGPISAARDLSSGGKYRHFGIHGTGFAPAVDSLAVLKRAVFEEKLLTVAELAAICDANFEGNSPLLAKIRNVYPKFGNDQDEPDAIAEQLLALFADSWSGRVNCFGGSFRAGTGSAMYYVRHPEEIPASPDGRLKGEPFPANYAPSLGVPVKGPLSVIRSFTKPDLSRTVNGGPLTMELSDSVFRTPEAVTKVAQMVRFFVERGGHQLQINTINRDQLLDAKAHPERWRHLIVRVWGWSGYFVELDTPYQDQIIQRAEMIL